MSLRLFASDHPEVRKMKAYVAFYEMLLTGRPLAPHPRPRLSGSAPRLRLVAPRSADERLPRAPVECRGG